MFSGIIKNIGKVTKLSKNKNNCLVEVYSKIKFTARDIGSSISCSGVCLTVEKVKKKKIRLYVFKETMDRTIFKITKIGDVLNLEKSLKFGDRLSGHFVQGHVDTTSKVKKIIHIGRSLIISFQLNSMHKKYVIQKGSISINGVSLTVAKKLKNSFQITIIPHTLKLTNLINLKTNDIVNIEFDVLGKYIKNFIN